MGVKLLIAAQRHALLVGCTIALCCLLSPALGGALFEENYKFCIRSEPALLSDMEPRISMPIETEKPCETTATLLTTKEKESFWSTMCKDLGGTHKEDYRFFRMRNGDLRGVASYHEICGGRANPLLAWIPYGLMQKHYAQELNPKEHLNCIAKATDVGRAKTELCHFRHSDLATNTTAELFTCTVMIFEDNFYGLDANINVLVQLEPVMYEVRNITYMPWTNATASYKTLLGKAQLKNPSREKKQIYSSIAYAFVEKVLLNVSSVYAANLEKLPLMFEHKGGIIDVDGTGVGGVDVKKKAYFGRTMDPQSAVNVDVIGQWAEHRRQFMADVYEYFGYGVKRFKQEMHNGDVAFVRIESTEPVFEQPESTNLAKVSLHSNKEDAQTKFERLSELKVVNGTKESLDDDWDENGHWEHPYPSMYPWFVVSALIVGCLLLGAIIMVVRSCTHKEDKHKYKIAGV